MSPAAGVGCSHGPAENALAPGPSGHSPTDATAAWRTPENSQQQMAGQRIGMDGNETWPVPAGVRRITKLLRLETRRRAGAGAFGTHTYGRYCSAANLGIASNIPGAIHILT